MVWIQTIFNIGQACGGNMWSNRVKEYREYHGMSQRELAGRCGTGHATISEIETGERLPNVVLAIRIAKALHTTAEELFWHGEETM